MSFSLGSTMFAGISSLLKFLRKSFQIESKQSIRTHSEQQFQTAVIETIRRKRFFHLPFLSLSRLAEDFAENLPDFQMMEIFQYILNSFSILNVDDHHQSNDFRSHSFPILLSSSVILQRSEYSFSISPTEDNPSGKLIDLSVLGFNHLIW